MKSIAANDWAAMLDELASLGVGSRRISEAMGGDVTDRMLRVYRNGVQPTHWRGEALVLLWCQMTGKARETAPQCEVIRGHRAGSAPRDSKHGDYSAGFLAAWAQIGVKQTAPKNKGRRSRKVKVAA